MWRVIILALGLFFAVNFQQGAAQSQSGEVCPALVQDALERVEQLCSVTGRNQICYGHSMLLAEMRPEVTTASLSTPGDITEIHNISHFQLMSMDVDLEQWGVAVMRVQANLPNTLPGQNALFLLFGDVELSPEPSLQLASTNSSQPQQPLNAFRLRTGVGAPECDSAPLDGLLIQTPHGVGRVELTINGVDLSLGSTVFIRAQPDGFMTVYTLEGSALLTTADGESLALAGTQVRIPMDENLQASASPRLPQRYNTRALLSLPLGVLDRPVEVHPALSLEEIRAIRQAIVDGDAHTLLPEAMLMVLLQPTATCADTTCSVQPTNTPTPRGSATESSTEMGGETSTALPTNSQPPNSPVPTTPPTAQPTNPPPTQPTNPPPTNPPPTEPPPQPTNPPQVTAPPTVEPALTAV